jgi:D-alanyl-lipoteichoic acid acyltransferase DltB (MBOAT superfamily)
VSLTSWPFAAFVLAVLALNFALPRRAQLWLLLAASLVFYGTWSWQFPLGLLALIAVNHWIARRLWEGSGRSWLWAGIGLNVLALGLLKYSGVFLPALVRALSDESGRGSVRFVQLVLPIGFSYRVLENISFLVDASRRQLAEFPRWPDYALYSAWFPKLVSGPIERGRAFLTQLPRGRVIDNDVVARAVTLILIGLVRKLVIADTIRGLIPAGQFVTPANHAGWPALLWLLVDVFVVYNDFAGYTDIVRGVSALFGIELARNFAAPFFSRNFSELWMRWHMSLSSWLRDYVYLPVSRALLRRSARPNTPLTLVVPPLAAMVVSALWHQAAWHMLAWGLLWGVFLFAGRIPTLWRPVVPPDRQPIVRQVAGAFGVVIMLAASNILFQMEFPVAREFVRSAFRPGAWNASLTVAGLYVLASLGIDWLQHRSGDEAVFLRWPLWGRSLALAVAILALFLSTFGGQAAPFIYQYF